MSLSIRLATNQDERFIHSSFHTAYWKTHAHKHLTKSVYDPGQDARIDRLLARSRVLVAFFPEVPDEVLGYSVVEGDALHYVYVKAVYRRRGIGTGLVEGRATCYTHATDREGRAFLERMSLKFNPYPLESP
jgi:GNAT superfamily N-acetyltransferase